MPSPFYTPNQDYFNQSRTTAGQWGNGGGSGSGWNNPWQFQDNNLRYQPYFDNYGQGVGEQSNGSPGNLLGWTIYDPNKQSPGESYDIYGADGNFLKTGQFTDEPGLLEGMFSDPLFWNFLVSAGGMAAFAPGGFMNSGTAGVPSGGIGASAPELADLAGGLDPAFGSTAAYEAGLSGATTGGVGLAPGMEYGYTDGGGIGPGADTTAYNTGSAGTPFTTGAGAVVPNGTGGGSTVMPTGGGTTGIKPIIPPVGGGGGGTPTGGTGFDLSKLFGLLSGIDSANKQNTASDAIIGWLNKQQEYIDGLYKPGSDEYNALWDQMSRTDAAAGRNSQYGPRSVDLAARLAEIKGNQRTKLATSIADVYANAINGEKNTNAGIWSALGGLFGGANGGSGTGFDLGSLLKLFSGGTSAIPEVGTSAFFDQFSNGTSVPSNLDNYFSSGGGVM